MEVCSGVWRWCSGSGGIGALREEEREGEKRKRERESGREIEGGRGEEHVTDEALA